MSSLRLQAIVLAAVCAIMFWWRLGAVGLIDPDEPFYAQTTREMVQRGDWITPRIFGEPQFEKPIFFYWQTIAAQKLLGDNPLAARVPSAVCATALVLLTWIFGRRFLSPGGGFWAALVLATGVEYAFMARLMLTDVCLALFVSASVFCFWLATEDEARRDRWIFLHFVASGLAALTKGPLGLLVPALGSVTYLWMAGKPSPWRGRGLAFGMAAWLLVTVPWYATMFAKFGREYWDRFFVHENWERLVSSEHQHSNHVWYYPMILTVGSLPWLPLLAVTVMRMFQDVKRDRRVLYLVCWIVPNLVFFTAAQSKLPTYTFFLFVALALLMGRTLDDWVREGFRGRLERIVAALFAIVQAGAFLGAAGWIGQLVPSDSNAFVKDLAPVVSVVAVLMSVPMILMLWGRAAWWAAATAGASAGLFALAFLGHAAEIQQYASTKGIAGEISRHRRSGEPVVTASFLARAVTYYTGEKPAGVVFYPSRKDQTQPFFTPHPLNFLVTDKGLRDFAGKYPSVLCVTQMRDLERISGPKSVLAGRCEELVTLGDRVLFRVNPAAPATAALAK